MRNLHKMKSPRNHATVIIMILAISIFALNLPHPSYVQADIKTNKVSLNRESKFTIQPKTIEQKGTSDHALARLRIVPGRSSGESEFRVERTQRLNTVEVVATGRLKVSENRMRVIIHDARNGFQLSMKSQVDPENSRLVLNTLSFNSALYKFAFDVGKARSLGGKMRNLLAEGKQLEVNRLVLQITRMLAPDDRYLNFTARVRSSLAFDALTTTASLLANATPEEINGDFTLLAITYATKILAPAAWMAAKSSGTTGMVSQQKPQIAKAGFHRTISTYNSQPTRSGQVTFCCSACAALVTLGIVVCFEMYDWCIGQGGGTWCDFFFAGCIAGDVAIAIECAENCTEC